MPNVRVRNITMDAIRLAATAPGGFDQRGTRRDDGDWDVPLSQETYDRVLATCLDGETMDDCIFRVLATAGKGRN